VSSSGNKISVSSIIAKQQWDVLKISDNIEIRYDKSKPDRNIPMYGGSPSLIYAILMLVLGAVFILFGTLRIIKGLSKLNQKKIN
ncbi:MAG TPA: hypothetical protein PKU86_06740, partial [Bacteroidales bacterium]|nr:hypothetical protein [Bacteroidales bacterium]